MRSCRAAGWLLVAAALAAGATEVARSLAAGEWQAYSLGEAWASVNANSLIGFGSLIENHVSPDLWVGVGLPLLNLSLWVVPLVPGVVALALCRRRRGGLTRRRS